MHIPPKKCICMYLYVLYVSVGRVYLHVSKLTHFCIYIQIHTDTYNTYRYRQKECKLIHADTYRYIQIHTDSHDIHAIQTGGIHNLLLNEADKMQSKWQQNAFNVLGARTPHSTIKSDHMYH
jgi:tRNA A37 threonylcarbamoyladenosine biosynthesis protein TsaE